MTQRLRNRGILGLHTNTTLDPFARAGTNLLLLALLSRLVIGTLRRFGGRRYLNLSCQNTLFLLTLQHPPNGTSGVTCVAQDRMHDLTSVKSKKTEAI